MNKIALIGSGQLGSRHLQGLASMVDRNRIFVVDPAPKSLKMAKNRLSEVSFGNQETKVSFHRDIEFLPEEIDLCIIATNSDVRCQVIKELLTSHQVNFMILEKFLFQKLYEYDEIQSLLEQRKVRSWVNCPRRMIHFFKDFRIHFSESRSLFYSLQGGNWEMASNAIHIIDHMAYITGETEYDINTSLLDHSMKKSKRKGFLDVSGTLSIRFKNGAVAVLHSSSESQADCICTVTGDRYQLTSNISKKTYIRKSTTTMFEEQGVFDFPFQSQLTGCVAKNILNNKSCELTTFEESCKLHLTLLKSLLYYEHGQCYNDRTACHIT